MKSWLLWFLMLGVAQAVLVCFTGAAAIHSPRYTTHSMACGALYLAGVELIATLFFIAFEWNEECKK